MIKAGALHQANGGYLILQARDLLMSPGSWDALKRALKTKEIRIEAMGEEYRLVPVRTIRPQPIPLDVKAILIGTPLLFPPLHQANGGYLILQARDLLMSPGCWDALKRALKTKEIRIEAMGEEYRLVPVRTIRPQPIPLDVKVILIGTPLLFHLLHQADEDFRKLFKIKADFDVEMPRDEQTMMHYAMFISSLCRREGLRHFDRGAVARVVEHA